MYKSNHHTIEIYSLWYDKKLKAKLNEFISSEVGILTNNRQRQIFKLTVLPKSVQEKLYMIQEIYENKDYNSICLTVKRKHVVLPNKQSCIYNTF